jgi:hypothetical protein
VGGELEKVMAELRKLEYFVLRYVADAATDEFVNFGLIVVEPRTGEEGFSEARFRKNWERVESYDPDVDIEMLEALGREIDEQLKSLPGQAGLVRLVETSYSGVIQLSETRGCMTNDPAKEIEKLASIYFRDIHASSSKRESRGTRLIRSRIKVAFEQAGVSNLIMRNIPASPYTREGDPLKFDFGYRVGDEIKLFHAVSLQRDLDVGMILAARYPKIADGIKKLAQATPVLTAVLNDDLDRGREEIQFALGMMEEARIRVAAVKEMSTLAEQARV